MVKRFPEERDKFVALVDKREKLPWEFKPNDYCLGSELATLKTADYTIKGYETEIAIERKRSTGEVSKNIYEERFERELQRLEQFAYPYLICEFNYQDILAFPINSGIPNGLWNHVKVTGEHLEKAIMRYQLKYKTKFIFAGKFGQHCCEKLFKYFMRLKNGKL